MPYACCHIFLCITITLNWTRSLGREARQTRKHNASSDLSGQPFATKNHLFKSVQDSGGRFASCSNSQIIAWSLRPLFLCCLALAPFILLFHWPAFSPLRQRGFSLWVHSRTGVSSRWVVVGEHGSREASGKIV